MAIRGALRQRLQTVGQLLKIFLRFQDRTPDPTRHHTPMVRLLDIHSDIVENMCGPLRCGLLRSANWPEPSMLRLLRLRLRRFPLLPAMRQGHLQHALHKVQYKRLRELCEPLLRVVFVRDKKTGLSTQRQWQCQIP